VAEFHFQCVECAERYDERPDLLVCPACAAKQRRGGAVRGVLRVVLHDPPEAPPRGALNDPEFLAAWLPIREAGIIPDFPVGGTPLLSAPRLRERLGMPELWVKDDTRNPSGSTKDRASLLVAVKALEYGLDTVAAASTGNAATALAACAAAAGLRSVVFVPAAAPRAKLVQMMCYGARVFPVEGDYDDAFELARTACERFGWYNRNTALNPFTIEGKKTAALEIAFQLGDGAPGTVIVPTGDGVILSGLAKGFADLESCGAIRERPRLIAVQPEGSPAIARAVREGLPEATSVDRAESIADSLNVAAPRNSILCLEDLRACSGDAVLVSDDQIRAAITELAATTGVFAEPAGATVLAGLRVALAEGLVVRKDRVVLLVTGTGLKDVPAAESCITTPASLPPDLEILERRLKRS